MKHSCWLLVVMLGSLGCTSKVDTDTFGAACLQRYMECSVSGEKRGGGDWLWIAVASRKNEAGDWDMWIQDGSTAEGAMGKLLPTLDQPANYPGSDVRIEVTP